MMTPGTNTPIPAPVRLAPIIRAPEREANNTQRRGQHIQRQAPLMPEPMFTMYVNSTECRHSVDLMKEVRDVHRLPCKVVDVASGVNIPTWLKGTPSIVVGKDVYCGDTAFDFAASVGLEHHQSQGCPPHAFDQTSSFQAMVSGKGGKKNDGKGCGLSKAFSPPVSISEADAEKKYSGSVDDAMARLMQSRG
ncbi:unnamed protein product [Ectocarpus sp. 4 AP-2014]